jgi:F-type H+-transporting ATPase subunit delta
VTAGQRALAQRYARALVAVASTQSTEDAVGFRGELDAFVRMVEGNPALRATLLHPTLRPDARQRVLTALCERVGASGLLLRTLLLLSEHDRLEILPALAEAYGERLNVERGILSAEVASATPLGEGQRRALEAALGGAVELRSRVDPGLVGGLVVRVAGKTYDGSVRGRLEALRRRLAVSS